MGTIIAVQNSCAPTLSVLRGRRKPGFGEAERKIANVLLPHLSRAWTIYQRLDMLRAGQSVLDALSYGVAFLTSTRSVVYCNRWAECVIREGDGLSLSGGRLCAADSIAEASLQEMLLRAISLRTPAVAVSVPRRSCRRAYQVVAAPLRAPLEHFLGTPTPSLVVFIIDPETARPADLDLLIQLYGLTPKEAL